MIISAFRHIYH